MSNYRVASLLKTTLGKSVGYPEANPAMVQGRHGGVQQREVGHQGGGGRWHCHCQRGMVICPCFRHDQLVYNILATTPLESCSDTLFFFLNTLPIYAVSSLYDTYIYVCV